MKPCGAVFTVNTQRKPMIVPIMLVSPFIVLGFHVCFATGIKVHSFLWWEIKNPIVFLLKLVPRPSFFLRLTSPDSILLGPMSWSPKKLLCPSRQSFPATMPWHRAGLSPQHQEPCPFTGNRNGVCELPNQTYCNLPAHRRWCPLPGWSEDLPLVSCSPNPQGKMSVALVRVLTSSIPEGSWLLTRIKAKLIKMNTEVWKKQRARKVPSQLFLSSEENQPRGRGLNKSLFHF